MSYSDTVQSIRKLLELSKKSPYEGESKNSISRAKALAEKYGIDLTDVVAKRETKIIPLSDKNFFHLMTVISDYFDCDAILVIGENIRAEITGLPQDLKQFLKYVKDLKEVLTQNFSVIDYKLTNDGKSTKGLKELYYIYYIKGMKSVFPVKHKPIVEQTCSINRSMPALDFGTTEFVSKSGYNDGKNFARWLENEVEGIENR